MGFKDINEIITRTISDRTEIENKMILSIKWLGEIIKHRNSVENIIRLFTAFETLLIKDRFESKGIAIAERLAFINHADEKSRINVYDLVLALYTNRNNLVHDGKTNYKKMDFDTLIFELRYCILTIAELIDKYPDLKSWIDLIKSTKFSGKLEYQN